MFIQNSGIYRNLFSQLDKVVKHSKLGSYKTRERYHSACKRFCGFLADHYKLEKLANVAPKHIEAYAKYMQERGLSASTVKTDLTSIRFFHDQLPNAKHTLPDNAKLTLEKRKFGGVNRVWSQDEFERMVVLCRETGNEDYICIFHLGYYAALRIEECFKLDRSNAEKALKTGTLDVRGKNGLIRYDVPIEESIKTELTKMLVKTERGEKLFVRQGEKTHLKIKQLQNFINYHRSKIQDVNSTRPLSFHGCRHAGSVRFYKMLRTQGYSDYAAKKQVSEWLGHQRGDVVLIYLFSIKGGEYDD